MADDIQAPAQDDDAGMVLVSVDVEGHAAVDCVMSPAAFAATLRELRVSADQLEAAAIHPASEAPASVEAPASDEPEAPTPATRYRRS